MIDFFTSNVAAIVLVVAGLCLLAIVMMQSLQVSKLNQRIGQITGGVEGGDLEEILSHHLETVHQVGRDLDELTARIAILESTSRHHFTRQGLIQFNPFPDTGGNQSFALALLDESDDGFIVSSLHSRTGTRIYAKAVTGGKADTSLSAEEQEAIDDARSKRPARPATPARSAAAGRTAAVAATPVDAPAPPARSRTVSTPQQPPAPNPAPVADAPAAPAVDVAPVVAPVVAAAPVESTIPAREMAHRPAGERAKGQEKAPTEAAPVDAAPVADERVDRKPGVPPAALGQH